MAKLSDVPSVMKTMGWKQLARKVWTEIGDDDVFTWASSLAYSWIFALFPFMVFLLTLAPYLPGTTKETVFTEIREGVSKTVTGETATEVLKNFEDLIREPRGGLLSIGLILAIWGASGGMSMTMTAIDRAYEVKTERSFIKHRLVAIGLTVGVVLLILIVLVLLPIGGAITQYFKEKGALGPIVGILIDVVRYVLAIALLFASVSLIYYFGPNIKQKWHAVTPGAIVTVVLWIVMGIGFSIYVKSFGNFNKTYGTLGAAIILLLFFYLSAAVLIIGAELNSVLDFAVTKVKPGTRDFTKVAEVLSTEEPAQRKDRVKGARSEADQALKGLKDAAASGSPAAPIPVGKAQAGWWKWAAIATIAGMAVGGKKRGFQ